MKCTPVKQIQPKHVLRHTDAQTRTGGVCVWHLKYELAICPLALNAFLLFELHHNQNLTEIRLLLTSKISCGLADQRMQSTAEGAHVRCRGRQANGESATDGEKAPIMRRQVQIFNRVVVSSDH